MNDQGFNTQQKQELGEILSIQVSKAIRDTVPPIVEEIVDKKLKPIIKSLNKMDKKLDAVIDHFDRRIIDVDKRLIKVEKHLGFETSPLV